MIDGCERLVKAIEAYIEKADDDLSDDLTAEGYLEGEETVKVAGEIEDEVADALVDETKLFTDAAEKADSLDEFESEIWPRVKAEDALAKTVRKIFEKRFKEFIPALADAYIKSTDAQLTVEQISKATTGWIERWSEDLGEIMKLNSHTELEAILKDGLKNGDSIATFTRKLMESGIRDEYRRARMTSITEVLGAHSVAQQEAFMQSPAVEGKMWRHTGSYRNTPRKNHEDMDGTVTDKNTPYTLTGADGETYYPMYPRDTILPAKERINCHCVSEPVVDEKILGMTLEERQRLQAEAIEAMDDEWEKQLDAENRAKAGIE